MHAVGGPSAAAEPGLRLSAPSQQRDKSQPQPPAPESGPTADTPEQDQETRSLEPAAAPIATGKLFSFRPPTPVARKAAADGLDAASVSFTPPCRAADQHAKPANLPVKEDNPAQLGLAAIPPAASLQNGPFSDVFKGLDHAKETFATPPGQNGKRQAVSRAADAGGDAEPQASSVFPPAFGAASHRAPAAGGLPASMHSLPVTGLFPCWK